ncbi:MAG: hypothetical protein QFC55_04765 [Chloroflexota bacterium]|nr:hypothetical protein [Chloroflexota bacterium]
MVDIGWRDAPVGEGQRYHGLGDVRWLQLVGWDVNPGLFAFRIGETAQYLGPVMDTPNGAPWLVKDVPIGDANAASDELYAVDGWLHETIIAECPAPNDSGPDTSTEYWCGGSFIGGVDIAAPQVSNVFDLGGLHVQWGAYEEFAPDPSKNQGRGTEPRRGIYLVRQIGCQPVTAGECPVWRMVGRLY